MRSLSSPVLLTHAAQVFVELVSVFTWLFTKMFRYLLLLAFDSEYGDMGDRMLLLLHAFYFQPCTLAKFSGPQQASKVS